MSSRTRQYGRQTADNNGGAPVVSLSSSSTSFASTPLHLYILDVPTDGLTRTSRMTTSIRPHYERTTMNDDIVGQNRNRSRTGSSTTYSTVATMGVHSDNEERTSRFCSNEYFFRDGTQAKSSINGYHHNRRILESDTDYSTSIVEALTDQVIPNIRHDPIDVASNSALNSRSNSRRLPIIQDMTVRYLKPNAPPSPVSIIVRETRAPSPPHIQSIIQQRPPQPRTSSPVIIREKSFTAPKRVLPTAMKKVIPPPRSPPRKWIIERPLYLPPDSLPVLMDGWPRYKKQQRRVIHEKTESLEPMTRVNNNDIKFRSPVAESGKQINTHNAEHPHPEQYYAKYRDKSYMIKFVPRKHQELRTDEELALIEQQQASVAQEEVIIKQGDEYNVRQILNHRKKLHRAKSAVTRIWLLFSAQEKRNIVIYILGMMLYKFGLEAFNGAIITLATNRYDQDAFKSGTPPRTFEKVGLLSGLNQAFQCVGSILIAPLIKRWPTRTVLSVSIFLFAIFTAVLMIVDASTGGHIKPTNFKPAHRNDFSYYGRYNTNWIIPIYCITGIAYGMVEVLRRIIPRDIVGGDVQKLQRMDALVQMFYELSGTCGAFATALGLIPLLGNNYAFIITPIFFVVAGIMWIFVSSFQYNVADPEDQVRPQKKTSKSNYFMSVLNGFLLFIKSAYVGGKIIFTSRKFVWLWSGYSLALYAHAYLEHGVAPQVARRYLGNSDWSQIIVGGSNFGELLGALFVFLFANMIKTPIPWLRLDALMLLIVWYIPYFYPPFGSVKYAWIIAATFIPISFGWSAGDVSLGAYIQSSLTRLETKNKDISPLGAVMSFLYSSYIIIYAISNPLLGIYIDSVYNSTGSVRPAMVYTTGVQFTIIMVVVFASTFIPKGAFALNPVLLYD